MRVLLIVPACDGEDVGEAWVGFQWAQHLSRQHDVTVLTYYKRGHVPVSRQLPGVRVVQWQEPPLMGRLERFNSIVKPAYPSFCRKARKWIRARLAAGERFDIAHQPIPVAMRYPSPATGLGIPLVLGPVGGGLDSPPGLRADEQSTPWYMRLREVDELRLRHDPLLHRTYTEAACVVGIADYVRERLDGVRLRRFEVMAETGLNELPDLPERESGRVLSADDPLRLVHVGRVIRTKGLRDTIRAIAQVPDLHVRLDAAGDGPDLLACQELVAELGCRIESGYMGVWPPPRWGISTVQATSSVFPSYREPGGNVIFEAMGYGLPLIVCDRGGPASFVTAECAIRVGAHDPDQLSRDVAQAIRALAADPERRRKMGRAAREHVSATGLWTSKVAAMTELYTQLAEAELSTPGTRAEPARRSEHDRRPEQDEPQPNQLQQRQPGNQRSPERVDAVIVTYNSAHVIEDLLDSLPAAFGPVPYAVVVVDNGSSDDTRHVVARRSECILVESENVGYAAGINRGVDELSGTGPILVLNPDVRLREGAVPELLKALSVPGTGVAAPLILDEDGHITRSLRREPTLGRALGLARTGVASLSEYITDQQAYRQEQVVDWALGAVLLVGRDCHEQLRGWDESYFLYSEETDFCLRARDYGYVTRFTPASLATHIGGQSGQSDRIHAMQIVNRVRLMRRRRGSVVGAAYYALTILSEASWIARGHRQSRFAVAALVRPSRRPPEIKASNSLIPR